MSSVHETMHSGAGRADSKRPPPVVVALDGSSRSERAVPFAAEQARASGSVLHLVHVHELTSALSQDPNASTTIGLMARVETQGRLAMLADRWSARGVSALPVLLEGDVVPTLLQYVARVQPGFMVMAMRGPAGVLRSRPGSITEGVLRASAAPVIVLPLDGDQSKPRVLRRVLVALDGGAHAERVLPAILDLVPRIQTVFLNTVLESGVGDRAAAQAYLDGIGERFRMLGVHVWTIVRESEAPAASIVDESIVRGADLIALTTHARPGSRLTLGSCTDGVLSLSQLPVLTVDPSQLLPQERLAEFDALACKAYEPA